MCGIVGLFLKKTTLEDQLGAWTARMLEELADRGPDSTGFAVYTRPVHDRLKLTLLGRDALAAWSPPLPPGFTIIP